MKETEVQQSERILERYKKSDRDTWAQEAQEDRAFKFGAQWKEKEAQSLEAANQPALADNEILPTINLVISILTENEPRFYAVGRDTSDDKHAGHVADLLSYIWYNSKGNVKLKSAVTDYEDVGQGALMAYADPTADWGKGEIKIIDIDPLELYIDPHSKEPDSSDAAHILVVKRLTEEQVRLNYPDFDFKGAKQSYEDDIPEHTRHEGTNQTIKVNEDYGDQRTYEAIDRYTKVKETRYHVLDKNIDRIMTREEFEEFAEQPAVIHTKMGQQIVVTDESEIERLIMEYEVNNLQNFDGYYHLTVNPMTNSVDIVGGVENEYGIPNSTSRIEIVTMGNLIQNGHISVNRPKVNRVKRVFSIGGKELGTEILPIEDYPIVTARLHHNRNPFPQGDIRLVKPLQEQLNKVDSLIIAYNTNISNIKAFIPKGSYDKKDLENRWGKAGAQLFEYEPDEKAVPYIVQLTQMSSSFYEQRQNLINQIQRIIGAYAFQDGQMSQAPQTKGGTVLIDEMMQRRTAAKRFDIESMLNQLAKVIMQLVPYVYDDYKLIRILVPNHNPKTVELNKEVQENGVARKINDVVNNKYDVQVISGSMMPTNKMVRREMLMEAYQNDVIRNPAPIIRNMDLPNVDEVLEAEDRLNQLEQALTQANEQIQDLQGDMQTADRELRHADRQIEKEKTKTDLAQIEAKVKQAAEVTQARLNDLQKNERSSNENAGGKND